MAASRTRQREQGVVRRQFAISTEAAAALAAIRAAAADPSDAAAVERLLLAEQDRLKLFS